MQYCPFPRNSLGSKNILLAGERMQIWVYLMVSLKNCTARFAHKIVCLFSYTVTGWLRSQKRPTDYAVLWSIFAQCITVTFSILELIAASFISAGCLFRRRESCPCPCHAEQTGASVRAGNWPAHIEMPAEACNQATGQLWGSWSHLQTARDYIFTLSYFFVLFHSHFQSQIQRRRGRNCWNPLF